MPRRLVYILIVGFVLVLASILILYSYFIPFCSTGFITARSVPGALNGLPINSSIYRGQNSTLVCTQNKWQAEGKYYYGNSKQNVVMSADVFKNSSLAQVDYKYAKSVGWYAIPVNAAYNSVMLFPNLPQNLTGGSQKLNSTYVLYGLAGLQGLKTCAFTVVLPNSVNSTASPFNYTNVLSTLKADMKICFSLT